MPDYFYHFTGKTLRDGHPIPAIGETLKHEGKLEICASGLHASPTPFDALQYAPGEFLHRVSLSGQIIADTDKCVASERMIVASIDATDLLRRFARSVALDVAHLWNPPEVVMDYLKTGAESTRNAARAAAWAAAGGVAGDAAGAAAGGVAWDAAGDAAGAKYRTMLNEMVEQAFNAQEGVLNGTARN